MPHFYAGFGLSIQADRALPGMIPVTRPVTVDTHVWLDAFPAREMRDDDCAEPWYVSEVDEGDAPALRVWRLDGGASFRLCYLDGTEFVVDRPGANVWARWHPSSTLADTATYLLGPVLGFVLRLRGTTCLHGSVVAVRDTALALVGPQGAGKSTTAAAFGRSQHAVLADDVVPLFQERGIWRVHPTYPQLRLWPDSVRALCGTPDALPPLTPTWDKRALDLTTPEYPFEPRHLPLAGIYLLGERSTNAAPVIEDVGGRAGLLALLGNTYMSYLLENRMRAREFEDLAHLVANVPVRRVTHSRELADVSSLCAAIVADCGALGCTA